MTDKILSLIRDVRPGGITDEKLAELTGRSLADLDATLTAMKAAGTVDYYVSSGMRFWKVPK